MSLMCKRNEVATRPMVEAVPIPLATRSYQPLPFGQIVDMTENEIIHQIPKISHSDLKWEFALGQKNQQLFAVCTIEKMIMEEGMTTAIKWMIALRSSYNLTLSTQFAAGIQVSLCSNLEIFGGDVKTLGRKHTPNSLPKVEEICRLAVGSSSQAVFNGVERQKRLAAIPVNLDRGYEIIGRAAGHGVLKPQQVSVALKDWTTPRYEAFAERNAFGLMQTFTEAEKNAPAGQRISNSANVQKFFTEVVN